MFGTDSVDLQNLEILEYVNIRSYFLIKFLFQFRVKTIIRLK